MYLKIDNEFADADFYFLETFLKIIDNELSQIFLRIKHSSDPDSDGLCDLGEYFIGHGFSAMQRYIVSTYPQTKMKKADSLKLGPKTNDVLFFVEAVDAGANYWKHKDEWPLVINTSPPNGLDPEHPDVFDKVPSDYLWSIEIDRTGSHLTSQSKRTFDLITKVTPYADYTLSNLLAELLE
ncbi:MAG: hypothetical protein AAB276_03215, partial [Pseudomonadota bacterium]